MVSLSHRGLFTNRQKEHNNVEPLPPYGITSFMLIIEYFIKMIG